MPNQTEVSWRDIPIGNFTINQIQRILFGHGDTEILKMLKEARTVIMTEGSISGTHEYFACLDRLEALIKELEGE